MSYDSWNHSATSLPTGASSRKGPLRAGQRVQLKDDRGKMHTITLHDGGQFHTQDGVLEHDELIGGPEGIVIQNTLGKQYQVLRPLLNDFVLSMPRGATVVYPKDAGQIIQQADIYPGANVVEAGVGSGALSISLLRAVGDGGTLDSYERREDFAQIATENVRTFFGGTHPSWRVHCGDFQEEVLKNHDTGSVDRVVLDMLSPWECVDAVATVLAPGGVWINYVATATQLSRVAEAIRADGRFTEVEASETMVRDWHLDGLAVRPEHRMIGHTGFLLVTRRLATGQETLQLRKRIKASTFDATDVEQWTPSDDAAWTPQALGERNVVEKRARKAARKAAAQAADSERATQDEDFENSEEYPGS